MAGLAQLRLSMSMTIVLVGAIFAIFLLAIMYLLQISWIYALIGTLIFMFLQYLIGPEIVKFSTRLRYLRKEENPWLESTVKELSEKDNISTPKLAIVPDRTPNAFVFGKSSKDTTLAVHEGLLMELNQEEIRGVIGHELGHIKHKDFLVMTILSALPLLAYLIARASFEAVRFGGVRTRRRKDEGGVGIALMFAAAISYVVYIISLLCVMKLSRLREHYADAYSAYLVGSPRPLESALTKIAYGLSLSPSPPHGARTLYISDPALAKEECRGIIQRESSYDLDKDGVLDEKELELAMEAEAKDTWTRLNVAFVTHPPTYQRILLLREIENEMRTGQYSSKRIYTYI